LPGSSIPSASDSEMTCPMLILKFCHQNSDGEDMQRIKLEQAAPGMILAKRVENERGMALCKEGTELTDSILLRFENAGIAFISVEGRPVAVEGEKSVAEQLSEVEHRFEKTASDPAMLKIKEIVVENLRNRYGEDPDGPGTLPEEE